MIPFSFGHEYYKKMLELQEKLRKSEEERIRLEERFNLMEQESRLKHETCINKLQMRYIEFLEEQAVRDQRKYKLLNALDCVDQRLALMSTKADRLCSLRNEYDAFFKRAFATRRQTGSVTGDSGVVSQNEDRYSKQDVRHSSWVTPRSVYDLQQKFHTPSTSTGFANSLHNLKNSPRPSSKYHINHKEWIPHDPQSQKTHFGYNNDIKLPLPESHIRTWGGEYLTNDREPVLKKNMHENFTTKPSMLFNDTLNSLLSSKEDRISNVLDNELDRYINKIRNLHGSNDPHSLEEMEQNTSGDLLNVTLSEDGPDHLPVEEKMKELEISPDVISILANADDLVSRTARDVRAEEDISFTVPCHSIEDINSGENASQNSLINEAVSNGDIQPVTTSSKCALIEKDKIKDDNAIHTMDSSSSVKCVESITKSIDIEDSTQSQKVDIDFPNQRRISENTFDPTGTTDSKESCDENQASNSDENININNMESQDLKNVDIGDEKMLATENSDAAHTLLHPTIDVPSAVENTIEEENQDEEIAITDNNINMNHNDNINVVNITPTDNEASKMNYESLNVQQYEEPYEQEPQVYSQNENPMCEYDNEQYNNPNQEYQYDSNVQYVEQSNEEYQYDEQNPKYICDSNAAYQDQMYINSEDQQYTINPDDQYQEYSGDPNQNFESEVYAEDPNMAYIANAHEEYRTHDETYTTDNPNDQSQTFITEEHHQEPQKQSDYYEHHEDINEQPLINESKYLQEEYQRTNDNDHNEQHTFESNDEKRPVNEHSIAKSKDIIKHILDSDTESIMEKNTSNTESDFDFN